MQIRCRRTRTDPSTGIVRTTSECRLKYNGVSPNLVPFALDDGLAQAALEAT